MISVLPSFGNFSTLALGFIVLCLIVEHKICGCCVFGMVFLLVWGEMILSLVLQFFGRACLCFIFRSWVDLSLYRFLSFSGC